MNSLTGKVTSLRSKERAALSGTVDSLAKRKLAATGALGVCGVTDVRNDILVKPRLNRIDSQIRKEITDRLHWEPRNRRGLLRATRPIKRPGKRLKRHAVEPIRRRPAETRNRPVP